MGVDINQIFIFTRTRIQAHTDNPPTISWIHGNAHKVKDFLVAVAMHLENFQEFFSFENKLIKQQGRQQS